MRQSGRAPNRPRVGSKQARLVRARPRRFHGPRHQSSRAKARSSGVGRRRRSSVLVVFIDALVRRSSSAVGQAVVVRRRPSSSVADHGWIRGEGIRSSAHPGATLGRSAGRPARSVVRISLRSQAMGPAQARRFVAGGGIAAGYGIAAGHGSSWDRPIPSPCHLAPEVGEGRLRHVARRGWSRGAATIAEGRPGGDPGLLAWGRHRGDLGRH